MLLHGSALQWGSASLEQSVFLTKDFSHDSLHIGIHFLDEKKRITTQAVKTLPASIKEKEILGPRHHVSPSPRETRK
eukprot:748342-Pelagomonas_calceolata.AAC.2